MSTFSSFLPPVSHFHRDISVTRHIFLLLFLLRLLIFFFCPLPPRIFYSFSFHSLCFHFTFMLAQRATSYRSFSLQAYCACVCVCEFEIQRFIVFLSSNTHFLQPFDAVCVCVCVHIVLKYKLYLLLCMYYMNKSERRD